MPAVRWADEPRLAFLTANLPAYEEAQEHKKTRKFLIKLHDNYFRKFPEPNEKLMAIETTRVTTWMNNHSGGRGKKSGTLMRATRVTFRELLLGRRGQKRRQKLQPTQAYSRLYYKSKWKTMITSEWEDKLKDEPQLSKKDFLAYRNVRMKEIYEAESSDVKAEVDQYRNAKPEDTIRVPPGEEGLPEVEQMRRIEARKMQLAIDNVEAVLSEIVREIEDVTGLKSHFMLGGLEPKRNGRMVMFTISGGRSIENNRSFKEYHPAYSSEVQDKFFAFIKGCYTKEDRDKCSNVPFPEIDSPLIAAPSLKCPPAPQTSGLKAIKNSKDRKRTRSSDAVPSVISDTSDSDSDSGDSSDSNDGSDRDEPPASLLGKAKHTINMNVDDEDMDIFSPHLTDDRRIVASKVDSRGLTLHRTAEGKWASEAELQRMANITRNARLMEGLGLEEAKRRLTTRPGGREDDKEPGVEDDQEFSITPTRVILAPRKSHPRQSKENVTYAEKTDGDGMGPISSPAVSSSEYGNNDAILPVHASADKITISNVVALSAINLEVPAVNVDTSVPDSDLPSPSTALDASSTPQATYADASICNESPMDVDARADLTLPMEVDNHASLDDISALSTPPDQSLTNSLQRSVQPVGQDHIDLSEVPPWLQRPLVHLRNGFRGELEDKVVGAFVALEMAWQPFEKRMNTRGRPEAVAWWIKNARPIDRVPPCINLASFPGQVRAWWLTIQPHWRVPVLEDWPLPRNIPPEEYWQEARLGGPNGLFTIVLCLYWWRRTAEEESDKVSLSEYESVAEDVAFVFEAILSSGVSQAACSALTGSTRANARPSAGRKGRLPPADETVVRTRTLRSTSTNVGPTRTRRSRI